MNMKGNKRPLYLRRGDVLEILCQNGTSVWVNASGETAIVKHENKLARRPVGSIATQKRETA